MSLFYIIQQISLSINIVDNFIDQDINILSSQNENLILARKEDLFDNNPFTIVFLNHINDKNLKNNAQLTKHQNEYSIKIGNESLCTSGTNLIKCQATEDFFKIEMKKFGFIIMKDELCLSIDESLEMKECGANNQIFVFRKLSSKEICESKESDFMPFNKMKDINQLENYDKINKDMDGNVTDEILKKRDKIIDDLFNRIIPNIDEKPKAKKILKKIYEAENGWSWPKMSSWGLSNLFCP